MLFCSSADCVPFKSVSVMTSWIIEPPVTTTWTCRPMISWPLKLAIIIQHWEILWRPSFNNPLEEFPWDGKVFVKGISPAVSHKTWSSGAISSIKAPISTLTIALSSKASSEGKTLIIIIVDKHCFHNKGDCFARNAMIDQTKSFTRPFLVAFKHYEMMIIFQVIWVRKRASVWAECTIQQIARADRNHFFHVDHRRRRARTEPQECGHRVEQKISFPTLYYSRDPALPPACPPPVFFSDTLRWEKKS